MISKNALVITSSHYGELKLHAFESDNILNASVEFDINTLMPTYKLLIGVPGESNALKISRILGLNPEVVDYAEKLSNENTNEISNVLEKLTKTSHELEKKLNETRNKEYLVNKKLDEIDTLKEKINKERSSDEFQSRQGKIRNRGLLKFSTAEKEIIVPKILNCFSVPTVYNLASFNTGDHDNKYIVSVDAIAPNEQFYTFEDLDELAFPKFTSGEDIQNFLLSQVRL